MQLVDPFIPVSPRPQRPAHPAGSTPQLVRLYKQPAGTVEGFIRPSGQQRPELPPQASPQTGVPHAAVAEPAEEAPELHAASQPVRKTRRFQLGSKSKTAALLAGILFTGTLAQSLGIGEVLVAAYAVFAFVRRVSSRTTFLLVLVSLGTVVALRLLGRDPQLSSNFAVYSFLLAFTGVVSLAMEVRRPQKQRSQA